MTNNQSINRRARFDIIRYAQGWEDAEILVKAIAGKNTGGRYLSVAAAGDNVLALLLLDPEKIMAADLSEAQLYCLQLRIFAFQHLNHKDIIELLEPIPSRRRRAIALELVSGLGGNEQFFWQEKLDAIEAMGLAGIGKFESYFSLFRRRILPFIISQKTCRELFQKTTIDERKVFFYKKWNNWRWKLAVKIFFSKKVMGKLGRDPAFFDYADGNLSQQIQDKVRHAIVTLDPHENPFMQWILLGRHQYAFPLAWRKENYAAIKERVARIECFKGEIQEAPGTFNGFNLSDIFEYMSPELSREVYGKLLEKAEPQARFVYWNMMVRRQLSADFERRTRFDAINSLNLEKEDKAFFYSSFIIEDVIS